MSKRKGAPRREQAPTAPPAVDVMTQSGEGAV